MLNNISQNYNLGIYNTPRFRSSAEAPVTNSIAENSIPNMNMGGIDALAAYNAPMIKQKDDLFDIPVVDMIALPQELETVEGEKVYTSNGELECVIQDNGSTKTVYRKDEDDNVIEIYDAETNELLKRQCCYIHPDKKVYMAVYDIKNDTGSHYELKGNSPKLISNYKTVNYPNGDFTEVGYECDLEQYHVMEYKKNSNNVCFDRSIIYDKNKNIIDVEDRSGDTNKRISVNAYQGVPYSVDTYSTELIDNNLGPDWQNDPDLIPAERYVLPENSASMEGVKTYYSNGNVETIENENGKFYFDFKGDVIKVEQGNKRISWYDNQHIIHEELGADSFKETIYFDNKLNSKEVIYNNNGKHKEVYIENNKIHSYEESDGKKSINYIYNEKGQIKDIWESDIVE